MSKEEKKQKKYEYEKTEAGFIYTTEGVQFHYVKKPKEKSWRNYTTNRDVYSCENYRMSKM